MAKPIVFCLWTIVQIIRTSYGVTENECNELPEPTFLKSGTLPTTALASFQGSGNTWMRQTLALASGYKAGDVYISYGDDVYPEFSSAHDDTVIASKTHMFSDKFNVDLYKFERAVVIVRNPLDSLYAEFNRMYGGNKTGYANITHLFNPDNTLTWKWDAWMTYMVVWVEFYQYWLTEFKGPVHTIYYNNLKTDVQGEVREILTFLNVTIDEKRFECTFSHPKSPYFQRETALPIDMKHLFQLHRGKEAKAIANILSFVTKKYGEKSSFYRKFDLKGKVQPDKNKS